MYPWLLEPSMKFTHSTSRAYTRRYFENDAARRFFRHSPGVRCILRSIYTGIYTRTGSLTLSRSTADRLFSWKARAPPSSEKTNNKVFNFRNRSYYTRTSTYYSVQKTIPVFHKWKKYGIYSVVYCCRSTVWTPKRDWLQLGLLGLDLSALLLYTLWTSHNRRPGSIDGLDRSWSVRRVKHYQPSRVSTSQVARVVVVLEVVQKSPCSVRVV